MLRSKKTIEVNDATMKNTENKIKDLERQITESNRKADSIKSQTNALEIEVERKRV